MHGTKRTDAGIALSDLILDLFRLNNRIIVAGDRLVANLGLTSARWQVLGTIKAAERPQPVAWLARDMGANRQNVQRIVNDLAQEQLVAFRPNPHHRRAQLVVLTDAGQEAFNAAMHLQAPWVNQLSQDIGVDEIETTHAVVRALRRKLEGDDSLQD
ncbi:MarR family transcriptional regulator [Mesorhizobium hawassense]|uniref:MarR family transcriptional regulator n=1 Tax=Mesorhizobium hawassense TaxID=1209954 RepID=A0A330HKI6_9HYPH|nr:MarR family winged helix-turn-helix transcriptional regulator [Mesorhizobium hawassense]RAZ87254.1 MarR family transcriptional regulator [Mesorhizobium hawassense]